MNWEDLEALRVVAVTRSFTVAAERLNVARPMVSKRISRLERAVGARLLQRTTRKVELTREGNELVEAAEGMELLWQNALLRIQSARAVAAPQRRSVACFTLETARFLRNLRRLAPPTEWHSTDYREDASMEDLASGSLNLVFGYSPVENALLDSYVREGLLVAHTILDEPTWVAVHADHRLATRPQEASLTDLSQEKWVVRKTGYLRTLFERWVEEHSLQPDVVAETDDNSEVKRLVSHGQAITLASPPAYITDSIRFLPLASPPLRRIFVAWKSGSLSAEEETAAVQSARLWYQWFMGRTPSYRQYVKDHPASFSGLA